MAEREFEVIPIGVDYLCDECNSGVMEPTGQYKLTDTLISYEHKCNYCNHTQHFNEKYPTVRFKRQSMW